MRSPAPYTLDAVVRGLWTLQGRPWTVSRLHVVPSDIRSQSEHGNDASVHKWRSLSTGANALSTACLARSFTDDATSTAPEVVVRGCGAHPRDGQGLAVGVQHLAQSADVPPEIVVLGHLPLDLLAAVQHRGMIPAAQGLPDPKERGLRLLTHEVHGDLAREDDLLVAGLALDLIERHAVVAGHRLDDAFGAQGLALRVVED